MNESNGKKQVAALWILGVLVVIFIAIIVGLFITQAKIKNQEVASKDAKIAQMEQELTQLKKEIAAKDAQIAQMEQELAQPKKQTEADGQEGIEGRYGIGDVIYEFEKSGAVRRGGNNYEEKGFYTYLKDNEITISFKEMTIWNEMTGQTTINTINRQEKMKIGENNKLLDENGNEWVKIIDNLE